MFSRGRWSSCCTLILACSVLLPAPVAFGQEAPSLEPEATAEADGNSSKSNVRPVTNFVPSPPDDSKRPIEWKSLSKHASFYLGVKHAFRFATEPGTREGLKGPFFQGYADSLGAMHGWSDGDPFMVNYVGHPLQGAVSGHMLVQHDPKFRTVEFGRDKRYWKSRLRALGYTWMYSTQFEIGPLSEASLGNVQSQYPAYGFVDHVITPVVGTGWMVAEDVLDKYAVKWVERKTSATWLRLAARMGLNPGRGFANVMRFRVPWYRDDRPSIYWYHKLAAANGIRPVPPAEEPVREVPVFEVTSQAIFNTYGVGGGQSTLCAGGGALGQWRFSRKWALAADVGGCRLLGLGDNLSGDSLTYLVGPRWSGAGKSRWAPHFHVLVGGNKVTRSELHPEKIEALKQAGLPFSNNEYHSEIATDTDKNAFAVMAGGGLGIVLHPALELNLAHVDYMRTWLGQFHDRSYTHNLRFTAGLTIRMGTW